jgi:hypothetical protein
MLFFPLNLKVSHDTQQPKRVSQRCSRDCSGVLAVASLEEMQGLLSCFVCVYRYLDYRYITQGGVGSALVGCYEPTAQVLLFPYTQRRQGAQNLPILSAASSAALSTVKCSSLMYLERALSTSLSPGVEVKWSACMMFVRIAGSLPCMDSQVRGTTSQVRDTDQGWAESSERH